MSTRNLIIAPCGNKSFLFKESWLKDKEEKQFDICLLFYHEEIEQPEKYTDVDFFYHLKGFKYPMIYELLTKIHPEWLNKYDYFYLLDDDIDISTQDINKLFQLSDICNSSISQAALSLDSFCSWPLFKKKKNSFFRFVGQIEVMAPLFNSESLKKCLPSFNFNKSSWGMDSAWSKILGYPTNKLIVFDQVLMKHTLPVGGGELYTKIGVDPHVEWKEIITHYGARKHNYQEYGRLELVDMNNNRLQFFGYKIKEALLAVKRSWDNYDLFSRIENRTKVLRLR